MKTLAISDFKARCLAILEEVRRSGEPVLVTRFGKPIAEVVPAPAQEGAASWMGSMRDEFEIVGDIISPIIDLNDIDALK